MLAAVLPIGQREQRVAVPIESVPERREAELILGVLKST
jgi:hypothetical protein